MAVSRKSDKPTGITNESGQPEILLEIEGLSLSFAPPPASEPATKNDNDAHGRVV